MGGREGVEEVGGVRERVGRVGGGGGGWGVGGGTQVIQNLSSHRGNVGSSCLSSLDPMGPLWKKPLSVGRTGLFQVAGSSEVQNSARHLTVCERGPR